ncbi:hypothetical protein CHS0354_024272 [Potamilus streckersoni]|uniref:Uncharacterized protein n=1 Tax=Potamilus streckersoni TaxID=2493646 RepID=A0AAE0SAG5_9BIVA|nr:hypothetical protein CHS0354_024272 [Potamilus streckersoni]
MLTKSGSIWDTKWENNGKAVHTAPKYNCEDLLVLIPKIVPLILGRTNSSYYFTVFLQEEEESGPCVHPTSDPILKETR